MPEGVDKTEFYQHEQNWSNRMILGDSLQVMASLAEREGLRGKVQCIYLDPPYGIKFNSNFQWSTTSRDVKDGKAEHITREPEQVKAFRDTWRDGIHSISPTCATASPSPATCSPNPARSSCRSGTRMSIGSGTDG
jgi:adenine-specific DNA-methyltransferase